MDLKPDLVTLVEDELPEGCTIVTFDIFDTLLHRRVRAPVDVFEMVRLLAFEQGFALRFHDALDRFTEDRMEAERTARSDRVAGHGGEGEITFDEIYDALAAQARLPDDIVSWLKAAELRLESDVLYPSRRGRTLYRAARARGVSIAFLSDMYLPPNWIAAQLEAKGFEGASDVPIYISGTHRLSKHSGALYAHVAREQGWSPGPHWLHIGDNAKADIEQAEKTGLRTLLADWARVDNRLKAAPTARLGDTLVNSLVDRLTLPQTFDNLPPDPLARLGYTIYGPLLFGFLLFLLVEFRARKLDRVLFVARDGLLPLRLFKMVEDRLGPQGVDARYFYMSRATGHMTGMRDWDPDRAWQFFGGKTRSRPSQILRNAGLDPDAYIDRLQDAGLDPARLYHEFDDRKKLKLVLDSSVHDILNASAKARTRYQDYYISAIDGAERIGLVDIGWLGNIQRCFVHSLRDVSAKDRIEGLYVGLHATGGERNRTLGLRMQGWLNKAPDFDRIGEALLSGGVELLEFILTADHGTTIGLADKGEGIEPVLDAPSDAERAYQESVVKAQEGVLAFVEDHLWLLETYGPSTLDTTRWAAPFVRLVTDPALDEIALLAGLTHADSPGATAERNALARKVDAKGPSRQGLHRQARAHSYWKAAFDKLNK